MTRKHRGTDRGRSSFDRNATNANPAPFAFHPRFFDDLANDRPDCQFSVNHREIDTTNAARLAAEHEAKPFVDLIVRIRSHERPTYEATPGGGLRMISDGLSDSQRELIQRCEAFVAMIYKHHLDGGRQSRSMPTNRQLTQHAAR